MTRPEVGGPVRRVRLRIQPGSVQVEKQIRVAAMTLPNPSDVPADRVNLEGFWYEAQSADGVKLYRLIGEDPTSFELEVPDSYGSISRQQRKEPVVVVDVLLPDLPRIADLVLFSSRSIEDGRFLGGVDEVARLDLSRQEFAPPGDRNGAVLELVNILGDGDTARRWNLIVLAEGFKADEQQKFADAVQDFADRLQDEPWSQAFNVYRLNVASNDSGAFDPLTCGDDSTGAGISVDTAFDASFCATGSVRRLLMGNDSLVRETADSELTAWHGYVVLVNSETFGGAAGNGVAWASLHPDSVELALHELGHAAFILADEYCCDRPGECNETNAPPTRKNLTHLTDLNNLAWTHLLNNGVGPFSENEDCTVCDTGTDAEDEAGQIGLFEGAGRYNCGRYRPAFNCRMRSLGQPFCRWCQELAERSLDNFLP